MESKTIREQIENSIQNGLIEEAERLLSKYKKVCDFTDKICSIEAIINIYKNKLNEALKYIKEGLRHNIFNGDLYFTMGNVYELSGEYDRAFLCYEHALEVTDNKVTCKIIDSAKENLLNNFDVNVNGYTIVILTYNNLEYTKICIDSIRKYNNNFELVVIDNNSTDGTAEWLKSQKGIKYILNEENRGFPAGCNQGIEISNKDNDIFLLNNDTVIMPNSIFNLRMGLYSTKKVGAVGAISNNIAYNQQVDLNYDNFDDYIEYATLNNVTDEEKYEKRLKLVGFAMLIKRQALNKAGNLDEIFTPGNYEDDDISLRIVKKRYDLLLCKDSYIHHFGNISFKKKPVEYKKLLKNNAIKFEEKWGFDNKKALYIAKEVIDLIKEKEDKYFRILQVGCGCGATLLEIKNRFTNSELYGVEVNKDAAIIAKQYFEVSTQNIERDELRFEKNFFDYIIFAEEIAHLYNPKKVLENMREYLKSDGYIIASIPNVMNYKILRSLINGSWNYTKEGIMAVENIRYFTKGDIINILHNSSYDSIFIQGVKGEYSDADENFINEISKISSIGEKEEFKDCMYLVKARKGLSISEKMKIKCMLLLRNLEFDIDIEKSEKEFIRYLSNGSFTEDIIIKGVREGIINKIIILNYVAVKCIEFNVIDTIIPLLNEAYNLDNKNIDTNCNLAYVLNMFGEKDLALEYLDKLEANDLRVEELKNVIRGRE